MQLAREPLKIKDRILLIVYCLLPIAYCLLLPVQLPKIPVQEYDMTTGILFVFISGLPLYVCIRKTN